MNTSMEILRCLIKDRKNALSKLEFRIGAHSFSTVMNGVQFRFTPKLRGDEELVVIEQSENKYKMSFFKIDGMRFERTSEFVGIAPDDLKNIFETHTGLDIHHDK